ncbi:uncharacterized protein RAG0_00828 [Rhynchosporium agropyri]|uniref:Uncharacterized protein n=1 Tax=Rhynchosporium agropyri TaxID=914238 RepID=A0A1E1JU48_9HELO|nr:uncharacterized protein RAG0_00828 [Rhynchosporium agropyri]
MPVWLPAISNTESTKCLQPVQHEVEKSTLQAEVCHQSHPFCDSTAFLNLTGVSNTAWIPDSLDIQYCQQMPT